MERQPRATRIFSLEQARGLLPEVKTLTVDAVRRVERLVARLQEISANDPSRAELESSIGAAVREWAHDVQELGLEAKGPWLVDFDNGEGYYCWCYPEDTVAHFHGYEEGFAGRMKII